MQEPISLMVQNTIQTPRGAASILLSAPESGGNQTHCQSLDIAFKKLLGECKCLPAKIFLYQDKESGRHPKSLNTKETRVSLKNTP